MPAVNIFHRDGGRCPVKVALRSLMAQACRSRRRQHGLQTFMEFERDQKISNSQILQEPNVQLRDLHSLSHVLFESFKDMTVTFCLHVYAIHYTCMLMCTGSHEIMDVSETAEQRSATCNSSQVNP